MDRHMMGGDVSLFFHQFIPELFSYSHLAFVSSIVRYTHISRTKISFSPKKQRSNKKKKKDPPMITTISYCHFLLNTILYNKYYCLNLSSYI